MKIRKILAVLVLISMIAPIGMLAMGDTEPNDDFEHAELIGTGTHTGTVSDYYDSSLTEHEDIDYYKVQVPAGKAILISLTGESGKTVSLHTYNEEKQDVYEMAQSTDGALDRAFYDGKSTTGYVIYLKISSGYDEIVNYTLKVEFRPSDIMSSATGLTENQEVSGIFYDVGEVHWYKTLVVGNKSLLITLKSKTGDLHADLYDSNGNNLYSSASANSGGLDTAFYDGKSSTPYQVYIKISTYDENAEYTINTEFRPSDIMSSATEINENQKVSDTLYSSYEVHWYKIAVPAGKRLNLSVSSTGDDVWVSLYKEDGTLINMDDGTSFSIAGSNTHDTSITAYIKVSSSLSTNKVSYAFTPKFQDISSGGGGNSGGSSPFVGAPLLILAVLLAMTMIWVRKRNKTS